MAKVNPNYRNVSDSYFFLEVIKRAKSFADSHPGVEILKLGIGNTTEAIVPAVVAGLKNGVEKLSRVETYTGYGDEQGDRRLREAVSNRYKESGLAIDPLEIFISDGAKPDCANIQSIFGQGSVVAVSDPVYPVYVDSSLTSGKKVLYLDATEENGFIPGLPKGEVDIIYICSPNNPTGSVFTRAQLEEFVAYALDNKAVIIFDAAYSEYIQDTGLPRSIYEIPQAKRCCIEIQSFSKSAGFTGIRLGWTVVSKELATEDSKPAELNKFWNRRQSTMFNGASNIAQEGGLAALAEEGLKQTGEQIKFYMENARIIRQGLESVGLKVFGGENAPYLWVKCPGKLSSWEFFDLLLSQAHVVCTPGVGFGKRGEGYVRLSAFGHRENIIQAVDSVKASLKLQP